MSMRVRVPDRGASSPAAPCQCRWLGEVEDFSESIGISARLSSLTPHSPPTFLKPARARPEKFLSVPARAGITLSYRWMPWRIPNCDDLLPCFWGGTGCNLLGLGRGGRRGSRGGEPCFGARRAAVAGVS